MKDEKELTYGETIKQPFPERDKIDWVKIEAPEWWTPPYELNKWELNTKYINLDNVSYVDVKTVHENSKDFKVTWKLKQTDPHADIKAEYEKAKEKYDVVKVIYSNVGISSEQWGYTSTPKFNALYNYKLRYYNIDWNKLLSWSYANGEFVSVVLDDNYDFRRSYATELRGIEGDGNFLDEWGSAYKYCRLAKDVEIKDEWLKEIK